MCFLHRSICSRGAKSSNSQGDIWYKPTTASPTNPDSNRSPSPSITKTTCSLSRPSAISWFCRYYPPLVFSTSCKLSEQRHVFWNWPFVRCIYKHLPIREVGCTMWSQPKFFGSTTLNTSENKPHWLTVSGTLSPDTHPILLIFSLWCSC
jgi:hypothetical protein